MKEYFTNIKNSFKLKHYLNYFVVLCVFGLFVALYYAGALNRSTPTLLNQIAYSVILAVSLNLVVGFLGELSLGHAGFMCVGAYIGTYVANLMLDGGTGHYLPARRTLCSESGSRLLQPDSFRHHRCSGFTGSHIFQDGLLHHRHS